MRDGWERKGPWWVVTDSGDRVQRTGKDRFEFERDGVVHAFHCDEGEGLSVYLASARPKLDEQGIVEMRHLLTFMGDPFRLVEPTAAGKAQAFGCLALVAAFLIGGLLYLNWSVFGRFAQGGELASRGRTVDATVTQVLKGIGTNSASYVDYTFTPPGGAPVSKHEAADSATADNAALLKTVKVRYLPSDPSQAQIARNDSDNFTLIAVALLDVGLVAFLLYSGLKSRREKART